MVVRRVKRGVWMKVRAPCCERNRGSVDRNGDGGWIGVGGGAELTNGIKPCEEIQTSQGRDGAADGNAGYGWAEVDILGPQG